MKVLIINAVCGCGSTGRIALEEARKLISEGNECVVAYGREKANSDDIPTVQIGEPRDYIIHGALNRIFDGHGFYSKSATRKFLRWVDEFVPDVIHLHNIHGYYINIELLFNYLKKKDIIVYWTLHDCWSFTGHCSYFDYVGCMKWKQRCFKCPQQRRYPASYLFDGSEKNYEKKKKLFCGVKKLTIIVPSNWLKKHVEQSFLREYPIEVKYNTIDLNVFSPTISNFRNKYGLENKKIILGVANVWEERKGLKDFLKLSRMLNENYVIVLVGLSERQIKRMPENIIGITRTQDMHELAGIYSAADVFVNPSVEETFGMTTIEAQACGTSVIIYKNTAGEEIVGSENAVPRGDCELLYRKIRMLVD